MLLQQQVLNISHKPTYQEADFVVTPHNRRAFTWVETWPQWSSHCLILFGPKGCGKTHLAHIWRSKTDGHILPYEDIIEQNLDDLCGRHKALVIEDLPEDFDEELIFHLYNAAHQAHGYILMTTEIPPWSLKLKLPDLRTRMNASMWGEILPADDDVLLAMMRKVFSDEQVLVSEPVLSYILNHQERSFENILSSVRRINTFALAAKRPITLPLVKQVLEVK